MQSCSFCKGTDNRMTNCPLKDSYGKPQDGTELIKYLTNSCSFSISTQYNKERIVSTDVSCQTGVKHLVSHMLHSKI